MPADRNIRLDQGTAKGKELPNEHVLARLRGIWSQLNAAHEAGKSLSSSSKGREREAFINLFLKGALPPIYRFGSGDITDQFGARSGQLDVVVELPFSPSLPSVGSDDVRLYLAEGVAAVIEVKSNLAAQWGEVQSTAAALIPLQRTFRATLSLGANAVPSPRIPLIAVGYTGWSKLETMQQHVDGTPGVDAAFVIDNGLFASSAAYGHEFGLQAAALWAMICFVHRHAATIQSASTDPFGYVLRAMPAKT